MKIILIFIAAFILTASNKSKNFERLTFNFSYSRPDFIAYEQVENGEYYNDEGWQISEETAK